MKYLKLFLIYCGRVGLRIFYIVPLKQNRIYFSADKGSGIRCNPMYIYRYMQKKYPAKYEFVWQYNGFSKEKDTVYVKPGSFRDLIYQLTSRVLISNDGFGSFLPKRKRQLFINTWHGGGAYKRSGVDFITDQHPVDLKINKICGEQTDIFLSGCKKFSDVMTQAKMVPRERFLEFGMPRNDFLVKREQRNDIIKKVKEYFQIEKDAKIVLFAPTYRGEETTAEFVADINVEQCLMALQKKFSGKWVFLMRKHHFVKDAKIEDCLDASGYPDMQELLYAADVFITDYSSTIWDYSLTFKPGFLFVPDLKTYQSERNFYTDPETWAFPLAQSNDELEQLILGYDQKKSEMKIKKHHKYLINRETGHATETIVNKIVKCE